MGKIIAIYFPPEEFGLFNLQFATYLFFFSLLVSPFIQYVKVTTKTLMPKIGYQNFLYLLVILIIVFYFFLIIAFNFYFEMHFYLYIILALMIISNVFYNILSDYFNLQNLLVYFSFINIIKSLSGLIFIGALFYLSYQYSEGVLVLWIIQIVGFIFGSIFFYHLYRIKFSNVFSISFNKLIKNYAKYAWPLMMLSFWSWIISFFDRYVIEYFINIKEVGIYNANYAVGSKFFLLLNPIFLTLLTPKIYTVCKIIEKKQVINKYVKLYIVFSIPILITVYFFSDLIGRLLLSKQYESGFYIIFWIAFAYFFMTLVYLYETIFYAEGKTKIILLSNIYAAVINILLNVLLIPIYGLNGAIIANITSFIIRFIVIKV
ncbi:MAG: polysaccharide biosynthesis C-terminal domain-containing protein, partial [Flavobacteriaceae bacterium]|nr:polysaccharide biosynthesis C-terminal domain-containing protein [Flavobacteriaceae bacterium]